jgi:hypothetical protein
MVPKKGVIFVALWRLTSSQFGDNPELCQTCETFPMACMVATFFQKSILSRVITESLLQPHPKSGDYHAIWLV